MRGNRRKVHEDLCGARPAVSQAERICQKTKGTLIQALTRPPSAFGFQTASSMRNAEIPFLVIFTAESHIPMWLDTSPRLLKI